MFGGMIAAATAGVSAMVIGAAEAARLYILRGSGGIGVL